MIGDRAFHRDPRVVALLAKSLMHGLLQAGMANCGKHFPGHGFVKADSHTEVPVDKRSLKAILADDAARTPAQHHAHQRDARPRHLPQGGQPPSRLSQRWLQEILRRQMRFDGAIFSDDLSMEGARRIDGQVVKLHRRGVGRAGGRLRSGAAVQPEPGRGPSRGRADRWAGRRAGKRPLAAERGQRIAPPGAAAETLPQPWDELMLQPAYMQALDLLP